MVLGGFFRFADFQHFTTLNLACRHRRCRPARRGRAGAIGSQDVGSGVAGNQDFFVDHGVEFVDTVLVGRPEGEAGSAGGRRRVVRRCLGVQWEPDCGIGHDLQLRKRLSAAQLRPRRWLARSIGFPGLRRSSFAPFLAFAVGAFSQLTSVSGRRVPARRW